MAYGTTERQHRDLVVPSAICYTLFSFGFR